MSHLGTKRFVFLAICTALISGVGCYAWGRSRTLAATPAAITGSAAQDGQIATPMDAMRIRKTLIAGYQSSPDSFWDWELLDQVLNALKQLPEGELVSFHSQIELASDSTLRQLQRRIFHELMARNPTAGMALVDSDEAIYAIRDWGMSDPVAAIASVKSSSPPAFKLRLLGSLLKGQAKENFPFVEKQIQELTGTDRTALLLSMAQLQSYHKKFLELAAVSESPENLLTIQKGVVRALAYKDYKEAFRILDTFSVTPTAKLELESILIEEAKDPIGAIQAWNARHPAESKVPDGVAKALWTAMNEPKESTEGPFLEWLNGLPAGGQRDSFYQTTALVLARTRRFELSVLYLAAIDDNTLRRNNLQDVHAMWQAADPARAATWRASLPYADLQHVGE